MKLFTTIFCIISIFFSNLTQSVDPYKTAKDEEPVFNGVIIADLHTDGNILRNRNNEVRKILNGVSLSENPLDAFVIAGDYSNAGAEVEKKNLKRFLSCYGEKGQILLQMGNHDSQATSDATDITEASERFRSFIAEYGIETDENYYYKEVNGVAFIIMATEKIEIPENTNDAFITEKQIQWLDSSLAKAAETNKPVFVITHQPLKGLNGIEEDFYNGVGSDAILSTIKKHTENGTKVVIVTGHTHIPLNANTFWNEGNLYSVNLPTVLEGADDNFDGNGNGVVVEVYKNSCVIRARDFIRNTWQDGYSLEFNF